MNIWSNPNFRNLMLANAISNLGDGFHSIAAMWWIKVHTGSDGLVAGVALVKGLTAVLLAPFAGALVDRYGRRLVMLLSNLARAVIVAALGALAVTDRLEAWVMIAASAVLSALDTLFGPAFTASIPNIVGSDQLAPANSSLQIAGTLAPRWAASRSLPSAVAARFSWMR